MCVCVCDREREIVPSEIIFICYKVHFIKKHSLLETKLLRVTMKV